MTAGEIVERIKKNLGSPWRDTTYRDTFKFGGADTTSPASRRRCSCRSRSSSAPRRPG